MHEWKEKTWLGLTSVRALALTIAAAGNAFAWLAADAAAMVVPNDSPEQRAALERANRRLLAGVVGGTYLYGMTSWWGDGFDGGFKTRNEGWFGADTDHGGQDKLGHFMFTYAGSRLLTLGLTSRGNDRDAALRLGTLTTYGALTGVEVLDGFSAKWSFSPEDFLMNTLGAGTAWLMETDPKSDGRFDFRFNYRPSTAPDGSRRNWEPVSDYSGQTYYFVTKASGFETLDRVPVLRFLELSLGYGARGFEEGGDRARYTYVGITLNLSKALNETALKNAGPRSRILSNNLFEYVHFESAGVFGERAR